MGIKLNAVKCPNCNAGLKIEEGRDSFYCSYCGAQIVATNENEHVYRLIDEASIIESRNKKDIKLKELEMRERSERKSSRRRIVAYGLSLFLFIFGLLIREADMTAFIFMDAAAVIIFASAYLSGKNRS